MQIFERTNMRKVGAELKCKEKIKKLIKKMYVKQKSIKTLKSLKSKRKKESKREQQG